jgi:hypothetical protein
MKQNKGCCTFLVTEDATETKDYAFLHELLHDGVRTAISELKISGPHIGVDEDSSLWDITHVNW